MLSCINSDGGFGFLHVCAVGMGSFLLLLGNFVIFKGRGFCGVIFICFVLISAIAISDIRKTRRHNFSTYEFLLLLLPMVL